MSLPEIRPFGVIKDANQYVGRYRSTGESDDLDLTVTDKGICLNGQERKRLIHKQDRTFLLEASSIELKFEADEQGAIRRFRMNGPVEIPESEWTKVS